MSRLGGEGSMSDLQHYRASKLGDCLREALEELRCGHGMCCGKLDVGQALLGVVHPSCVVFRGISQPSCTSLCAQRDVQYPAHQPVLAEPRPVYGRDGRADS